MATGWREGASAGSAREETVEDMEHLDAGHRALLTVWMRGAPPSSPGRGPCRDVCSGRFARSALLCYCCRSFAKPVLRTVELEIIMATLFSNTALGPHSNSLSL